MEVRKSDEENNSRRRFIKNSFSAAVALSMNGPNAIALIKQDETADEAGNLVNEGAQKLMKLFDLKYPIFQAAPGGDVLATALANEGAMGAISLTMNAPDAAFQTIKRVKASTKGSFYGNYILHFAPDSLDKALEAGLPAVQFSWGIPNKTIVSKIRTAKASLGIQVASRENAKAALDLNPDFLICQGIEAGGHVQANDPLMDLLQGITEEAHGVPVLASGGITNGNDIRKALKAGAAGVVMGTRLMATKESDAHEDYKRALVEAGENDTVFTTCFDKGWSALHRVLKNKTFVNWQAAGCPLAGQRPGENDILARGADDFRVERYSIMPPIQGLQGKIRELAMYAGIGVSKIKDIPSAKELLLQLWKEVEK